MIDVWRDLQHIDGELNIDLSSHSLAPLRINMRANTFSYDRIAVVREPVGKRNDWRIVVFIIR